MPGSTTSPYNARLAHVVSTAPAGSSPTWKLTHYREPLPGLAAHCEARLRGSGLAAAATGTANRDRAWPPTAKPAGVRDPVAAATGWAAAAQLWAPADSGEGRGAC